MLLWCLEQLWGKAREDVIKHSPRKSPELCFYEPKKFQSSIFLIHRASALNHLSRQTTHGSKPRWCFSVNNKMVKSKAKQGLGGTCWSQPLALKNGCAEKPPAPQSRTVIVKGKNVIREAPATRLGRCQGRAQRRQTEELEPKPTVTELETWLESNAFLLPLIKIEFLSTL